MAENRFRPLTRDQLSRICGGNMEAVRAFEKLFQQAGQLTPDEIIVIFGLIQNVAIDAATAAASANSAMASLQHLLDELGLLPTPVPAETANDVTPPVAIGTLGHQNAETVAPGTDPVTITNAAPTGMTDTIGSWLQVQADDGRLYLAPLFEYAP